MKNAEVELVIENANSEQIAEIERYLSSIDISKSEETRDLATAALIIGLTATTLEIIKTLIEIKKHFEKEKEKEKVVRIKLRDIDLNEINVLASDDSTIQVFVENCQESE